MTCSCVVLRNLEERVDVWIKQNLTNIFFFNEFNSEKQRLQKQEGMCHNIYFKCDRKHYLNCYPPCVLCEVRFKTISFKP